MNRKPAIKITSWVVLFLFVLSQGILSPTYGWAEQGILQELQGRQPATDLPNAVGSARREPSSNNGVPESLSPDSPLAKKSDIPLNPAPTPRRKNTGLLNQPSPRPATEFFLDFSAEEYKWGFRVELRNDGTYEAFVDLGVVNTGFYSSDSNGVITLRNGTQVKLTFLENEVALQIFHNGKVGGEIFFEKSGTAGHFRIKSLISRLPDETISWRVVFDEEARTITTEFTDPFFQSTQGNSVRLGWGANFRGGLVFGFNNDGTIWSGVHSDPGQFYFAELNWGVDRLRYIRLRRSPEQNDPDIQVGLLVRGKPDIDLKNFDWKKIKERTFAGFQAGLQTDLIDDQLVNLYAKIEDDDPGLEFSVGYDQLFQAVADHLLILAKRVEGTTKVIEGTFKTEWTSDGKLILAVPLPDGSKKVFDATVGKEGLLSFQSRKPAGDGQAKIIQIPNPKNDFVIKIQGPAKEGVFYDILYTDDLSKPFQVAQGDVPADPSGITVWKDEGAETRKKPQEVQTRFYAVRLKTLTAR